MAKIGSDEDGRNSINKKSVVEPRLIFRLKKKHPRRWIVEGKKEDPINDFLSRDQLIQHLRSNNFIEIHSVNRNYISSFIKFNGVQRVVFSFRRRGVDFCVLNDDCRFQMNSCVWHDDDRITIDFSDNVLFSVRYNYKLEEKRIHKIIISLCNDFSRQQVLGVHYFIERGYFRNNERFFSLSASNSTVKIKLRKVL